MKKSHSVTKSNSAVSGNVQRNDQIEPVYTKELNIYGKMGLFGIYTAACLFLGGFFFPQGEKIDLSALDSIKKGQAEVLVRMSQLEGGSSFDATRLMQVNSTLVDRLEGRVVNAIASEANTSSRLIDKQKREISDLKNRIQNLLDINSMRSPASVRSKSIPYSLENMSVLRFEHRQERKFFLSNQKVLQDAFLETVDLSLNSDVKKWKSFKAKQELDLYKLKQKHYAVERKFRETGYRVSLSK